MLTRYIISSLMLGIVFSSLNVFGAPNGEGKDWRSFRFEEARMSVSRFRGNPDGETASVLRSGGTIQVTPDFTNVRVELQESEVIRRDGVILPGREPFTLTYSQSDGWIVAEGENVDRADQAERVARGLLTRTLHAIRFQWRLPERFEFLDVSPGSELRLKDVPIQQVRAQIRGLTSHIETGMMRFMVKVDEGTISSLITGADHPDLADELEALFFVDDLMLDEKLMDRVLSVKDEPPFRFSAAFTVFVPIKD